MTDTLTTAKSLTKQTVGGNVSTWGTIENATWDLVDKALGQTLTKALTVNVTLTATEAQNIGYNFTGALAGAVTVTFPTFYGPAIIRNKTTGGFSVTVGMASGTTVAVAANASTLVFSDGTDFVATNTDAGTLTTGTLPSARVPAPAWIQASPANPSGTTSTTLVMMGCGGSCTFTPQRANGKVQLLIYGGIQNSAGGGDGAVWQLRYGTGTAPANGAALAGTGLGAQQLQGFTAAAQDFTVPMGGVVSGLTVGTAYWFDVALAAVTGGTAKISNISASALES